MLVVRPDIEDAMRAHCEARWSGARLAFAPQALDQIPEGFTVPPGRSKPWGTAHAALAAAPHLSGPFAVCNADDLYGRPAYATLAAYLVRMRGHALVTYRLEETLSAHGGVSRGVCDVVDGVLQRLEEVHDIRRDGPSIRGRGLDDRVRELSPAAPTSMNLWGFQPEVLPLLHDAFVEFLADRSRAGGEFLLSSVVGDLVATERARVAALPTTGRWRGMTHPEDRDVVAAALRALVAEGTYPASLAFDLAVKERT